MWRSSPLVTGGPEFEGVLGAGIGNFGAFSAASSRSSMQSPRGGGGGVTSLWDVAEEWVLEETVAEGRTFLVDPVSKKVSF
jgi:hypothetical protein